MMEEEEEEMRILIDMGKRPCPGGNHTNPPIDRYLRRSQEIPPSVYLKLVKLKHAASSCSTQSFVTRSIVLGF